MRVPVFHAEVGGANDHLVGHSLLSRRKRGAISPRWRNLMNLGTTLAAACRAAPERSASRAPPPRHCAVDVRVRTRLCAAIAPVEDRLGECQPSCRVYRGAYPCLVAVPHWPRASEPTPIRGIERCSFFSFFLSWGFPRIECLWLNRFSLALTSHHQFFPGFALGGG